YFGGIKLGAGGLVRAYSDTVVATLEQTPLVVRQRMLLVNIHAPHAEVGRVENDLRSANFAVLGTDYAGSTTRITVGPADVAHGIQHFNSRLAAMTAGAPQAEAVGIQWQDRLT